VYLPFTVDFIFTGVITVAKVILQLLLVQSGWVRFNQVVVLVSAQIIHLVGQSLHGCGIGDNWIGADLVYLNSEECIIYLVEAINEEE